MVPTRRNVAIARRRLANFFVSKFRCDHRKSHGLLLKERNAQGFSKNSLELILVTAFWIGIDYLLYLGATSEIGMHHIALDRPRPHDRDLDDEIVKYARLQTRQHVHLRPALDLEDAERIRPAQHIVGRPVIRAARSRACKSSRDAS